MGEKFATLAKLDDHVGYDPESAESLFYHLMESPDGILIISDKGMIGGLCYPHPFNSKVRIGQEVFWWSEGRDGALLLGAAEQRAKELGCAFWGMITVETVNPDRMARYYEKRGYKATERAFMRAL